MNLYVDASVVLRVILAEPNQLRSWSRIDSAVSSELIRVECLRAVDRARIEFNLADDAVSRQRADVLDAITSVSLIPIGSTILDRAAEPFPTQLGTLDAIHLASALLVREQFDDLIFATHDRALGIAARAMGFQVQGI